MIVWNDAAAESTRVARARAVRTCGARRQLAGQQVGDALEVVVARVAEVRGAEAEEHGHRAAVPALVLQQIGAVFGAHLGAGHVAAPAAHQLGRVVVGAAHVQLASGLAAVVGLENGPRWSRVAPGNENVPRGGSFSYKIQGKPYESSSVNPHLNLT